MGGCSLKFRSTDLSEWVLFNLVPRALFPGFGGGAPGKAREKRPGDAVGFSLPALRTRFTYEADLTSLECREIRNSFQICHSGFLRNEPTYQLLQRLCVIC